MTDTPNEPDNPRSAKDPYTWEDRLWTMMEGAVMLSPILVWLTVVPLFWLAPAAKPEGDNSCTHWESCLEEVQGVVLLTSPDQKGNKNGPSTKEETGGGVGDDHTDTTLTGL